MLSLTLERGIPVNVFNLVLNQMLMMFLLMAVGFILKKLNVFPEKADIAISRLETFIFVPALNFYTQLTNCTVENFLNNSRLMFFGLIIVAISIIAAYPVSRLFIRNKSNSDLEEYQRNIYKYALTFGNFGFMGNFIVLDIWGEETFFKYTMFCFFITLFCSAWGLYILIPKNSSNSLLLNLKKGLITPPMIALFLGMICGLLGLQKFIPDFVMTALVQAKNCMGPAAMILAGVVIGGYNFKSLITDKKVYVATFLRLIVIPSIFVIILKCLKTDTLVIYFTLIAFATPLGMNTIVYPASYGGDTRTGASMTMISQVISVITIPLMFLIFT